MIRARHVPATLLLICLLGGLTACGGGEQEAGTDPSTSPSATEDAPTSRPAAQTTEPAPQSSAPGSPAPGASAPADTVIVTIADFAYSDPGTVAPGSTVRVENTDDVAHTVTAEGGGATFDVTIAPGRTASFTAPDRPGDYPFVCTFHAGMTGTLVVG